MKSTAFVILFFFLMSGHAIGQESLFNFGKESNYDQFTTGKKMKEKPLGWIQVNTNPETWKVKGNELFCTGTPVGVIRTRDQYENFILHVEWSHSKPGGNSGVFAWSNANPGTNRLPDGIEAQILDPGWITINTKNNIAPPEERVHGELFGMGGVQITPDNPSGAKSIPVEFRCRKSGEWNTYDLICVDGTIKLSVNGKVVNGISYSSQKKGYVCLESEGSPIRFRNIKIVKLP